MFFGRFLSLGVFGLSSNPLYSVIRDLSVGSMAWVTSTDG